MGNGCNAIIVDRLQVKYIQNCKPVQCQTRLRTLVKAVIIEPNIMMKNLIKH